MAGSIARQPWRLGLILLLLASFVAALLMMQVVFSDSTEQMAQISETGATPEISQLTPPSTGTFPGGSSTAGDAGGFTSLSGSDTGSLTSIFLTYEPGTPDPGVPDAPATGALKGMVWQQEIMDGPLEGISVYLADAGNNLLGPQSLTDVRGGFSFPGLAAGDYKVYFADPNHLYQSGWYGAAAGATGGAVVHVGAGSTVELSFLLTLIQADKTGSISGQVTDSSGHAVSGADVLVYRVDEAAGVALELKGVATTDDDGNYRVSGLEPTETGLVSSAAGVGAASGYKVQFMPPTWWGDYSSQWYQGQSTHVTAKLIPLHPLEQVDGIDAMLVFGGSISGHVRLNGEACPGALVDIYDESGIIVDSQWTFAGGNYQSDTLASGKYRIRVTVPGTSLQEWYTDRTDFFSAVPVTVHGGSYISDIDIALDSSPAVAESEPQSSGTGLISAEAATLSPDVPAAGSADQPVQTPGSPADDGSADAALPLQQPEDGVLATDESQGQLPGEGSQDQVAAGQPQVDNPGERAVEFTGQRL